MRKMLLLFSHELTAQQKSDAQLNWNVESFIYLPSSLQQIWSNIDPNLASVKTLLKPIESFVQEEANSGDMILVQGDFGASFLMVKFAKELEMVPVYATTKRIIEEYEEDGRLVKKTFFEHQRFREY